jgi:hypothetical protein
VSAVEDVWDEYREAVSMAPRQHEDRLEDRLEGHDPLR